MTPSIAATRRSSEWQRSTARAQDVSFRCLQRLISGESFQLMFNMKAIWTEMVRTLPSQIPRGTWGFRIDPDGAVPHGHFYAVDSSESIKKKDIPFGLLGKS